MQCFKKHSALITITSAVIIISIISSAALNTSYISCQSTSEFVHQSRPAASVFTLPQNDIYPLSPSTHTFSSSHLWSRNRFPPSSVLSLHAKRMAWRSGYWISTKIILIELSYKSWNDEKAIRAVITPNRWGTCIARQAAATSHTAWKLKNKSRYIYIFISYVRPDSVFSAGILQLHMSIGFPVIFIMVKYLFVWHTDPNFTLWRFLTWHLN